MVTRTRKPAQIVHDGHLWRDVARTVTPLARRPRPESPDEGKPDAAGQRSKAPARRANPPLPMPDFAPQPKITPPQPPVIEPRLTRRLRRGQLPIDSTIDLHGMTQAQAHRALHRFVAARQAMGDRTLLVITGKGLKKSGFGVIEQMGVLRAMLPQWLAEAPLSALISGWEPAGRTHGGEGAFYVRLKRGRQ